MKDDIESTSGSKETQTASVRADERPTVVRKSLRVRTGITAGPGGPIMPIIMALR